MWPLRRRLTAGEMSDRLDNFSPEYTMSDQMRVSCLNGEIYSCRLLQHTLKCIVEDEGGVVDVPYDVVKPVLRWPYKYAGHGAIENM